jgi:hypothetical protein
MPTPKIVHFTGDVYGYTVLLDDGRWFQVTYVAGAIGKPVWRWDEMPSPPSPNHQVGDSANS